MTDSPSYIAICAGGGLGCEGFRQAGWRLEAAVELEEHRRRLLNLRFPGAKLFGDLRQVRAEDLPRVDCWFSTTPCTSFSLAGSRRGLEDPSGDLFLRMLDLYQEAKRLRREPRFVLIENVPGMLSDAPAWQAIQDKARTVGLMEVVANALDARLFGVPQKRERVFALWSSGPASKDLPTLQTVPWRQFPRSEMPPEAWGAEVSHERLRRALDKVERPCIKTGRPRGGPGVLRRLRQFQGLAPRPACWRDKLIVYCDHGRSSVSVGQANTVGKTSRLMALDPEDRVVMLGAEGWEYLMGAPSGFTDGAGLSARQRQEVCGDGICVPVARAVGEWFASLL